MNWVKKNNMNNLNAFKEFSNKIDEISEFEELHKFRTSNTATELMKEFWSNRIIALTTEDELIKEKALAKIQWIQQHFGSGVPIKKSVNRFTAPHGLYGIFMSQGAKVGKHCIIYQQVTIGSNTIIDSKGAGFPTIGENVFIGAGAKIIGNVKVGDHARIGANCVITKDVPANAVVVPASNRIIQKEDIKNIFIPVSEFKELLKEKQSNLKED